MNKNLFSLLLVLAVAAAQQQVASAWCKFNAGIGANIGYSTGGSKSILWGAYQSSDYNAVNPQAVNGAAAFPFGQPGYGGAPQMGGPSFGATFGGGNFGAPGMAPSPYSGFNGSAPELGPMPAATPEQATPKPASYPTWYPQSDWLPVGYGYPQAGFWYGN